MAPRPSPSLCHPLPARASFGKAGLTQSALSKPCGGEGERRRSPVQRLSKGWHPEATLQEGDRCGCGRTPAKPRARKQKSQDETLDTGPHRPRGSREGHWPERPMPPPAPPQPRLATSLSLRPSGPPDAHPNMAWETDPWRATAPTPGKATGHGKGKRWEQQTPPGPHCAAEQPGVERDWPERGEEGQERGCGPVSLSPAPSPCPSTTGEGRKLATLWSLPPTWILQP